MKRKGFRMAAHGLLLTLAAGVISIAVGSMTAEACTSYYAGKKVTADGSILFGRTEDIGGSHSKIFKVYPAAKHAEGEMYTDVTSFTMPWPAETYRYTACEDDPGYGGDLFGEVGTNEFGVSMSATESASPVKAIRDADPFIRSGITESSMVSAVLPCVKTAREGVEFLADIVDTYGAGEGNTLMIADKDECWYIEILSGHQYAAIKMPDDKAAMMPNCFMIQTIDVTDTEHVIASEGLISTAEQAGTLVRGEDESNENLISVKNSYAAQVTAGNSYRIWGGQIIFNPDLAATLTPIDTDYEMFVTPKEPVTVQTLYKIAGTQYEGTDFEGQGTVIGSYRTCESHIMQIRPDMPTELATIEWLAMGSADLSPVLPFYSAAITDTLPAYKIAETTANENSAYWAFRSLASLSISGTESRDVAAVNIKQYWTNYVNSLIDAQPGVDEQMLALYAADPSAVLAKATNLGMAVSNEAIANAKQIYKELLARVASTNGQLSRVFTPSLLTEEQYSAYSYDMVYEPKNLVATQEEVNKLTTEAANAKAEAEKAKKEAETAKQELAKAQEQLKAAQTSNPSVTVLTTNKSSYTVKKGKKITIKVKVKNAAGKKVTFKSSAKRVAKVTSKGVIKGMKKGKATITIQCNGVTKKVKVTVK